MRKCLKYIQQCLKWIIFKNVSGNNVTLLTYTLWESSNTDADKHAFTTFLLAVF